MTPRRAAQNRGAHPFAQVADPFARVAHPFAFFAKGWGIAPRRDRSRPSSWLTQTLITTALLLPLGCTGKPASTAATQPATPHYPPRPTTPPPTFHLLHQTPDTLTLVVPEATTDTQLTALLYQLRDAAQSHTFDTLHIPQKLVDARDPKLWFHIYRGPKCATEKYTTGAYPCGPSYHAAADFTLGSFKNPNRTEATLNQDETHQTELWNPDESSSH